MRLISVNLGRERKIQRNHKTYRTGIFKEPVDGPVQIDAMGLAGDVIKDSKNHGGVDQAVYIYGGADYAWWENELDRELPPGTFGENLTISELESAEFQAGDRLQISEVVLEVTAPRIPCRTLAARMGDPQFIKKFRRAERPGLYCRVIQPGLVRAGESVTVQRYIGGTVSVLDMYRDFYEPDVTVAGLRRFLDAPIDIRSRREKETLLAALRKKF
jgi:MOSC domain-containing protein YiiM